MTQPQRPPLEYATPSARTPRVQPVPVAVVTIFCGTLLLLAPWICLGLGNAGWSSLIRSLHDWPFFWITELLGLIMIAIPYLRADRP